MSADTRAAVRAWLEANWDPERPLEDWRGLLADSANTILTHGSDELKATYLRPIVAGEHKWCQLFSEPG